MSGRSRRPSAGTARRFAGSRSGRFASRRPTRSGSSPRRRRFRGSAWTPRGPDEVADAVLRPLGTEVVVAGADFRFGRGRSGDLTVLGTLGFETRTVPLVEGVSSSTARDLLRAGEVERASSLLGRPPEVEGT